MVKLGKAVTSGSHSLSLSGKRWLSRVKGKNPTGRFWKPRTKPCSISSRQTTRVETGWVPRFILLGETYSGVSFRLGGAAGLLEHRASTFTKVRLPRLSTFPFQTTENDDRHGSRVYHHRTDGETPVVRNLHRHLADGDGPIRQVRWDGHGDQLSVSEHSTTSGPLLGLVRNATVSLIRIRGSLEPFLISRLVYLYVGYTQPTTTR